jgi:hypothetical protein
MKRLWALRPNERRCYRRAVPTFKPLVCLLLAGCAGELDTEELGQELAAPAPCPNLTADEQAIVNNMESGKAALETALGHDNFFVRDCASGNLRTKACTASIGEGNYAQVGGWLGELTTDSSDAEVRSRAGQAAPLFITESLQLKKLDLKVTWSQDPATQEWTIPDLVIWMHVVVGTSCDVRTYEMLGGAPAEPVDVQMLSPSSPDACGRGELGAAGSSLPIIYNVHTNTSYQTQIFCTSSNPGALSASKDATIGAQWTPPP